MVYPEQAWAVADLLRGLFQESLLGAYLYGSAVSSGLRPRSDIDLLAVVAAPMTRAQRKRLASALLELSVPHPAPPGGIRCIDLTVFIRSELAPGAYPVQAEFLYGEWLRRSFEAGQLPVCVPVAGNTLLLAQARQDARCLSGADVTEMVPEISMTQVKRAMRDALPALMGSLHGDERNVLLTLARMWRTDVTEEFVAKDVAATWASTRMPDSEASILGFARDAHLGLVEDVWEDRRVAAADAADFLMRMISESGRAQQLDPHG